MLESNLALIKRDEDNYDDAVDAERQRDLLSLVRICYIRFSLRICTKAPPLPVGFSTFSPFELLILVTFINVCYKNVYVRKINMGISNQLS